MCTLYVDSGPGFDRANNLSVLCVYICICCVYMAYGASQMLFYGNSSTKEVILLSVTLHMSLLFVCSPAQIWHKRMIIL